MLLTSLPNEILIKILKACYPPCTFSYDAAFDLDASTPEFNDALFADGWSLQSRNLEGDTAMKSCSTACQKLRSGTKEIFEAHRRVAAQGTHPPVLRKWGDVVGMHKQSDERYLHLAMLALGLYRCCCG